MGIYRKVFKKAFGSKLGKKIDKFISNPLRRIQRSHKFGRLGHSVAPTMSDSSYITHAYNKLMSSMGKSAMRAAERQAASVSGNSAYTASVHVSPSQRMDYSYRRLSDLMR